MGEQGHTQGLQSKGQLPKSHRGFSVSVFMGFIDCSELARRKTRGSEGLNTYWSSTLVIVKVTAALGGLANKISYPLSFLMPEVTFSLDHEMGANSHPFSSSDESQPMAFPQRGRKGQDAAESFPPIAGENKLSLCCGRLDWKARPGRAYSARQPGAAQKPRGKFVLSQLQGAQCPLGPGLVGFVVPDRDCLRVFNSWGEEW